MGPFILLSSEDYDAYIVVSFTNATLVLSIGETVEEVTDSGFLGTTPTLTCAQLGEDALIQVGNGVVVIPPPVVALSRFVGFRWTFQFAFRGILRVFPNEEGACVCGCVVDE